MEVRSYDPINRLPRGSHKAVSASVLLGARNNESVLLVRRLLTVVSYQGQHELRQILTDDGRAKDTLLSTLLDGTSGKHHHHLKRLTVCGEMEDLGALRPL